MALTAWSQTKNPKSVLGPLDLSKGLMPSSRRMALAATLISTPASNYGSMILPFMISNTLFLARMRSILVFHALKLDAPSNLFSDFIE
jgi:hypothetical protein